MATPIWLAPRRFLYGLGAVLLLAGCSAPTRPGGRDHLPRPLTSTEQAIITGSNSFAFSLFRELEQRTPDSNVVLSPLSASMALGMTMNGAAGSTLDAMRTTLGFSGLSLQDIDGSYQSLIDLLRSVDPNVDFRIANSIWYRQGFPVESTFLAIGMQYFDAQIQGLDFSSPGAVNTINNWVNQNTNGKIPSIVDHIDDSTMLYLINAIYFKGIWTHRFDPGETRPAPFHAIDGAIDTVKMMHQHGTFPWTSNPGYQVVELPYGAGPYVMDVVVPTDSATLDSLVTALTPDAWQALAANLHKQTGDVYLPKFQLTWEQSLIDALTALGMGVAFQGGAADFTPMSASMGRQLAISSVKQKTFIDVDESGTEAAAATAVGVVAVSISMSPVFRADRPFLFAIRERYSGTILFIGAIVRLPPAE